MWASWQYIIIDKYNLLKYYAFAWTIAFKGTTIASAFQKTGIYPFDHKATPITMYEPAKNFTTHSTQPLPAQLPSLLTPIDPHSTTQSSGPSGLPSIQQYHIALPPQPPWTCNGISKDHLLAENANLQKTINAAGKLLEANFTQMMLYFALWHYIMQLQILVICTQLSRILWNTVKYSRILTVEYIS